MTLVSTQNVYNTVLHSDHGETKATDTLQFSPMMETQHDAASREARIPKTYRSPRSLHSPIWLAKRDNPVEQLRGAISGSA